MSPGHEPPRIWKALLRRAIPDQDRDALLGELDRLYGHRRERHGRRAANRWFRNEAIAWTLRAPWARRRSDAGTERNLGASRGRRWRGGVASLRAEGRIAARSLLRSPGFSFVAVMTLALGIGSTTSIYSVVEGVLLAPLPLPDAEELILLCEDRQDLNGYCVGSVPTTQAFGREARSLVGAGTARSWSFLLTDEDGSEQVVAGIGTPDFFRVLGIQPRLGRLFREEEVSAERDGVVILSDELWSTRFGSDPTVLGRTVSLDGESVEIVGVMPPNIRFSIPDLDRVELWRPVHVDPADDEQRAWRGFIPLARLTPGVSKNEARAELQTLYDNWVQEQPAMGQDWTLSVLGLQEWIVRGIRPTVLALLGAVGLLLLIAWANAVSLMLARASDRSHEFAMRMALGARPRHLARSITLEALILTAAATALGIGIAYGGVRAFLALVPAGLPLVERAHLSPAVLGFTVLLAIGTTLLVGWTPALRLRFDALRGHLSASGTENRPGQHLRRAIVVGQIAVTLVLLFGSALVTRTALGYLTWEPGFDRSDLTIATLIPSTERLDGREGLVRFLRRAEALTLETPGVVAVGTASSVPLRGGRETSAIRVEGSESTPDAELPTVRWYDVGPTYFQALGVPLIDGRWLDETDDLSSSRVVLVNETFAHAHWPDESAIGRWVEPNYAEGYGRLEVVGVVGDVRPFTPGGEPEPEIYWSNRQFGRPYTLMAIRSVDGTPVPASGIRSRLETLDPDVTVRFATMEELEAVPLAQPRFNALLISVFAGMALLLATVGVYGVMAYRVQRGHRTIGIRLALGSDASSISWTILREGLSIALPGLLLGGITALFAGRWFEHLVSGVSTTDTVSLVAVLLVLISTTVLATSIPARRAGRVDPASLLREE